MNMGLHVPALRAAGGSLSLIKLFFMPQGCIFVIVNERFHPNSKFLLFWLFPYLRLVSLIQCLLKENLSSPLHQRDTPIW